MTSINHKKKNTGIKKSRVCALSREEALPPYFHPGYL
jgi:hypothetical protein